MPTSIRGSSKIATTTVNTTVAETEIAELVLPANGLWTPGAAARFTAAGDLLSNTGSAETVIFKFLLGATTVFTTPAVALPADADRRQWRADILILSVATDSQRITGHLQISDAEAGTWVDDTADGVTLTGYGTAARDDAAEIDVTLTVTLSTSSASLEATCKAAVLELLR